jgi:hypothetical protein
MDAIDWIALIAVALPFVIWIGRLWITAYVTKRVEHTFSERIEVFRSDLRQEEEAFRARLRAAESDLASIRSGALAALTSRHTALMSRRLEAVDQVWAAVRALEPVKGVAVFVMTFNFAAVSKEAATNPQLRQIFAVAGNHVDMNKVRQESAWKARPHVSPLAWALYAAYEAILLHAMAKLHLLSRGINSPGLFDVASLERLVKTALPNADGFMDQHGIAAAHHLLDELEAQLLDELRNTLQSSSFETASVVQAAAILTQAEGIMQQAARAPSN